MDRASRRACARLTAGPPFHRFTTSSAHFEQDNLGANAGVVPLLGPAEQTSLPEIIADKHRPGRTRARS